MSLATTIRRILPVEILGVLERLDARDLMVLEEIRLGAGRPLAVSLRGQVFLVGHNGDLTHQPNEAFTVAPDTLRRTLELVAQSSLYALEEELRQGYVTVEGGHRVGVAGRAVLEQGRVKTQKAIGSLNIRVAREVKGTADKLLPHLIDHDGQRLYSTLVVSPPQCGKTTLLRDLVRLISGGRPPLTRPYKVGVVDERSEIAACFEGIPQLDVGSRTDILDACPKAEGMMMMIRSMSPEVLATDEIGRHEDALAIEEALHAGVTVLATAHGQSMEELQRRPVLNKMLANHYFARVVILCRQPKPATVQQILRMDQDQWR